MLVLASHARNRLTPIARATLSAARPRCRRILFSFLSFFHRCARSSNDTPCSISILPASIETPCFLSFSCAICRSVLGDMVRRDRLRCGALRRRDGAVEAAQRQRFAGFDGFVGVMSPPHPSPCFPVSISRALSDRVLPGGRRRTGMRRTGYQVMCGKSTRCK